MCVCEFDLETSILSRYGSEFVSCSTKKYITSNPISRFIVLLNINFGKSQNNNLVKSLQKVRSIVCFLCHFPLSITRITQQKRFYRNYVTTTSLYSVFQIFKKKMVASVSWNKMSCVISRLFFKYIIDIFRPRTGHEVPGAESRYSSILF